MKFNIKTIIAALALAPVLSGCLQEYYPTSNATADEIAGSSKAGLSNAIPAYLLTWSSDDTADIGWPGFMMWRDTMTADFPIGDSAWDYYPWFASQNWLGDYALQTLFWQRYYSLAKKCNLLLEAIDPDNADAEAAYIGNALCYRAMAYFDMARMYEYRLTGVGSLDAMAESRGVIGMTVPIVPPGMTEQEARNNPRVPYWHIYRYILTDLNKAEKVLVNTRSVASKTNASLAVAYGMQARLWLEMATRYQLHADDMAQALLHEDDPALAHLDKMGQADATGCFRMAADYARKAINEGFSPLERSQWYDKTQGFNTPNNAWIWCISLGPNNTGVTDATWQSWISYTSPEATYGLMAPEYTKGRMIDAALFQTIEKGDWRRATWIDPTEAGLAKAYTTKYSEVTSLPFSTWKQYGGYVGFKFHPGSGDGATATIGNVASMPLMRVEEMYLIEAEATAYCSGGGAGKQKLEEFVNTYRWSGSTPYICPSSDAQGVSDEVFRQKRIEFWGEGVALWDYLRLEKPVIKGYAGTNHPEEYRCNSYANKRVPWAIIYIPNSERSRNPAVVLNPDMSNAIPLWTN